MSTEKVLDELKRASTGQGKFAGLPKHVYTLFLSAIDALAQERADFDISGPSSASEDKSDFADPGY